MSMCLPHETAWPNQNSLFWKCEPVVNASLGFWNVNFGTSPNCIDEFANTGWLVSSLLLRQAHWKKFLLTHYETLKTLIGSCMYNSLPIMTQTCGVSIQPVWPSHLMKGCAPPFNPSQWFLSSFICGNWILICISTISSIIFYLVLQLYLKFVIRKCIIKNFSIDWPCSPPVGQHKLSFMT